MRSRHHFPGGVGASTMFLLIIATCLASQVAQASKLQQQPAGSSHSALKDGKTSARRSQQSKLHVSSGWRTEDPTTTTLEPQSPRLTQTDSEQNANNETSTSSWASSTMQQQQQLVSLAPEQSSTVTASGRQEGTQTLGSTESSTSFASSTDSSTTGKSTASQSTSTPNSISMSLDGMLMNSRPRVETSVQQQVSTKSKSNQKKTSRQGEPAKPSRRVSPSGQSLMSPATKGQRTKAKQTKQQEKTSSQKSASSERQAQREASTTQANIPLQESTSLIDGLDLMRNLLGSEQQGMSSPDDMVMSVMSTADGKERRLVMIARDTLDTLQRFAEDEAKRQEKEQQQQKMSSFDLMQQQIPTTTLTSTSSAASTDQTFMKDGWSTATSSETASTGSQTTAMSTPLPLTSSPGDRINDAAGNASVDLGTTRDTFREVPLSALVNQPSTTPTTTTVTSTSMQSVSTETANSDKTNGQQRIVSVQQQQQQQQQSSSGSKADEASKSNMREAGSRKLSATKGSSTPAGKTNGKRKNNKSSINKQTTANGKQAAAKRTGGGSSGSVEQQQQQQRTAPLSATGEPPMAIGRPPSPTTGSPEGKRQSGKKTAKQPASNDAVGQIAGVDNSSGSRVAPSAPPSGSGDGSNTLDEPGFGRGSAPGSETGTGADKFDSLRAAIPGEPLLDYPIYSAPPKSSFDCMSQSCPGGYYADIDSQCQAFHICQNDGRFDTFLCPNGTIFSQQHFVCVWWWQVDCQQSANFYKLNDNIYCNSMLVPSVSTARNGGRSEMELTMNELGNSGSDGMQPARSTEAMDTRSTGTSGDSNKIQMSAGSSFDGSGSDPESNLQQQHLELLPLRA